MTCNNRKLRVILTASLVTVCVGSLFTNIYYVYKFGPPYQPAAAADVNNRIFSPIPIVRHKGKVRRNLVNVATNSPTAAATSKPAANNRGHSNSFVLAATYSNTIGSLPNSLLQLGQFAKDLDIPHVVAPWVFGYRIYGVKKLVAYADKGLNNIAIHRLYDLKFEFTR